MRWFFARRVPNAIRPMDEDLDRCANALLFGFFIGVIVGLLVMAVIWARNS